MTVDHPPVGPSAGPPAGPPRSVAPLVSLQVLRAVAASMVVLHHAGYEADLRAARAGYAPLGLDRVVDLGFGVHLFFVISGFIMLRTARGFGTGRGALVFMARRAVRVVPLYWLLTSAALIVGALAPQLLNGEPGGLAWVAGSYLFVPVARSGGAINPVLGQGWTLDYEMFFYFLFALALPLPRRAALPALALALVGLVASGRLVAPPFAAAAVWTDELLLEFLFGLALAAAAMGPWAAWADALSPVLREGIPAALIVGACVLGPRWRSGRAVAALAAVGDASYSLYLSHPFAVRALGLAWTAAIPGGTRGPGEAPGWLPPALFVAAACAAAVAAALALYRFVERPMTAALQRLGPAGRDPRPVLPGGGAGTAARAAGRR